MTLVIRTAQQSSYRRWYEENKQRLSEKRKRLYADDPEYRERALEASKRRMRGEQTLPVPPDAPISFAVASKRVGVGISTLHRWRRKKYFPEPKHQHGGLWFTEEQVLLLGELKEFFRVFANRSWNVRIPLQKQLLASINEKWQ
jgi:hypothetical protein